MFRVKNLKKVRRRRNMSQEQLAYRSGVSKASISSYENGVKVPSASTLVRMAFALGISVDMLIGDQIDYQVPDLTKKLYHVIELIRSDEQIFRFFIENPDAVIFMLRKNYLRLSNI